MKDAIILMINMFSVKLFDLLQSVGKFFFNHFGCQLCNT